MSTSPYHLAFGPAGTAVDSGYTLATTATYKAAAGFGWQSNSGLTAYANSSTDHGVQGTSGTFLADVPNGAYQVTLKVANAGQAGEELTVSAQGLRELDYEHLQLAAGQYRNLTLQTVVTNGQLTLTVNDAPVPYRSPGTIYFSLAALDIAAATTATAANTLPAGATPSGPSMILQNYSNGAIPTDLAGDSYPNQLEATGSGEGGMANISMATGEGPFGNALDYQVTSGQLYAEFDPYASSSRGFASQYSADPASWQDNTYNRMAIWIKVPTNAPGGNTNGNFYGFQVGIYVKSPVNVDAYSDETGNGHYYHLFDPLNSGTWQQLVLNMHPRSIRSGNPSVDLGVVSDPTGDAGYNYFDELTRFYLESINAPSSYDADYQIGGVQFYQQSNENDQQIYNIAATYVPDSKRIWVTWSHEIGEDTVYDDIRYSFKDIHQIGWDAATAAPSGTVGVPPKGGDAYNGRIYDNSSLPLSGHSVVYIAIKPENSDTFSEVAIPLNLDTPAPATSSTTLFTDSFDRADSSTLGSGWTQQYGSIAISSNQAVNQTVKASIATANVPAVADVKLQTDVNLGTGTVERAAGLLARYSGPGDNNYYLGWLANYNGQGVAEIYRRVNGVTTLLASTNVSATSGTVEFDVVGTSLTLLLNGQQVASATDTAMTSGLVGIRGWGTGEIFDNFAAATPGSSATSPITSTPLYTDAFDRSNSSTLGSGWSQPVGSMTISSNQAVNQTVKASIATANIPAVADVKVQTDVNLGTGTVERAAGLLARYSGPGDNNYYLGWLANYSGQAVAEIYRRVNGVTTLLASANVSATSGTVEFDVIGTSLTLLLNGQQVATATDTALASGLVGIRGWGTGEIFDNFAASTS